MRSDITKDLLQKLYIEHELTPYEIAIQLKCNHKTIRNKLKAFNIPMRTASEYNFIAHRSHISPDKKLLNSSLSIAGHTMYLCEGWHTEKANHFYFCNTEASLVDLMIKFLEKIYQVRTLRLQIIAASQEDASSLSIIYPQAKVYIEPERITPIIRLYSGGKTLVTEVVTNAYILISNLLN